MKATVERRRGRPPVPNAVIARAAAAVRRAEPRAQVRAVMAVCGVEESTAKKYTRLARKRGFLPTVLASDTPEHFYIHERFGPTRSVA